MMSYTHLAVGVAVGRIIFPNSVNAQIACAIGAILPDLVMIPSFITDKAKGKQPLQEQSKGLLLAKNISHSSVPWAVLLLLSIILYSLNFLGWMIIVAFSLVGFLHVVIDVITHRGKEFMDNEPSYIWPIPFDAHVFSLWEYRHAHGRVDPKFPEIVFLIVVAIIIVSTFI